MASLVCIGLFAVFGSFDWSSSFASSSRRVMFFIKALVPRHLASVPASDNHSWQNHTFNGTLTLFWWFSLWDLFKCLVKPVFKRGLFFAISSCWKDVRTNPREKNFATLQFWVIFSFLFFFSTAWWSLILFSPCSPTETDEVALKAPFFYLIEEGTNISHTFIFISLHLLLLRVQACGSLFRNETVKVFFFVQQGSKKTLFETGEAWKFVFSEANFYLHWDSSFFLTSKTVFGWSKMHRVPIRSQYTTDVDLWALAQNFAIVLCSLIWWLFLFQRYLFILFLIISCLVDKQQQLGYCCLLASTTSDNLGLGTKTNTDTQT